MLFLDQACGLLIWSPGGDLAHSGTELRSTLTRHCTAFVPFAAADTPAQRVQFLLGTEDGDEEHIPHALFTELDEICLREGEDAEWKETARYATTLSHPGALQHPFQVECGKI